MTTGQSRWDEPLAPARYAASKVPLITAYFWIIKLLTTAMGEATSDYMVRTINPVIAVVLGFLGFAVSMVLQFRTQRYVPWVYWLAVAMVAVFGTQAADVLHIKFHVPYAASTAFYGVVLVVIFILWYRSEGTLSIHSIRTPRREVFYWATVLATFALGTATGDMTARTMNLGYLASGIWFSLVFAAVAVAHWKFRLNPILAFWIAYVLTRPVGASFADYVAFPTSVGGLDVGHGPVALVLTILIVIFVGYLTRTRLDIEDPRQAAASARHRRGVPEQPGYPPAYPDGYDGRYQPGYPDGRYQPGYADGYPPGYADGRYQPSYADGYPPGYADGRYQPGYPDGYQPGYPDGRYQPGYADGYPPGSRPLPPPHTPPRYGPPPSPNPPRPAPPRSGPQPRPPRDPRPSREPSHEDWTSRDPSQKEWPSRELPRDGRRPREQRSGRGEWSGRDQRPGRGEWPEREEWSGRGERQAYEQGLGREQRPPRGQSRDPRREARRPQERWRDEEEESQRPAEGFFFWDEP